MALSALTRRCRSPDAVRSRALASSAGLRLSATPVYTPKQLLGVDLQPAVNAEHIMRTLRYVFLRGEPLVHPSDPVNQGCSLAQAQ